MEDEYLTKKEIENTVKMLQCQKNDYIEFMGYTPFEKQENGKDGGMRIGERIEFWEDVIKELEELGDSEMLKDVNWVKNRVEALKEEEIRMRSVGGVIDEFWRDKPMINNGIN